MTPAVIGLALSAAVLHATWNAVLRSRADRLWAITVMSLATAIPAAVVAPWLPFPQAGCWPWLIGSALLQVAYGVFLAFAYDHGDLGQVYPLVRGSVPLLVTLSGFTFAGQPLSPRLLLGVGLVSTGVMSGVFGDHRAPPKAAVYALITGVFIAAYITADGVGVRRAGDAQSYIAWICVVHGAAAWIAYRLLRGRFPTGVLTAEGWKAMAGGALSRVGYGLVTTALAYGPLGPIVALRETNSVFSILIGRFALGEAITHRRVFVCAAVAAGALIVAWP
jgi:drug/metabolite transporter (DMT)-like permease